jgi:tetratricopeptide (TPR) repeat protein
MTFRSALLFGISFATATAVPTVSAQSGARTTDTSDPRLELETLSGEAIVNIHVTDISGKLLPVKADVKLFPANPLANRVNTENILGSEYLTTVKDGLAHIDSVRGGDYNLDVTAAGYQPHHEKLTVIVGYAKTEAFVKMHPFDGSDDNVEFGQPGAPPITPAAQRDVELAVSALQSGKRKEAEPRIRAALKRSPGSPDVHYLAGYIAESGGNDAAARDEYEAAVKIFPAHLAAQIALGNLFVHAGDGASAVPHLQKAISAGPNSWRAHWLLAEAYLQMKPSDPERAREYADRAIVLGKDRATSAIVTLALADAVQGDLTASRAKLLAFLKENPKDSSAPRAKQVLDIVEKAAGGGSTKIDLVPQPANDPLDLEGVSPEAMPGLPAGVDLSVPAVTAGTACELPQVLVGAAFRSAELVDNIQRFSAKELVVHENLDSKGTARNSELQNYDYVAAIERPLPNLIVMREMRDGVFGFGPNFPGPLAMDGIPAIGLIFNRAYSPDFSFRCEGLGQWHGQPAWQVRFEQKPGVRPRIHQWRVNNFTYPAHLKGRAWLTADSYELLHLETDLAQTIHAIRLEYQHISIDYSPVAYPGKQSSLWLPSSAQIYYKYKGHFYRQAHSLSNFTLFSVETREKIAEPHQKGGNSDPQ